MNSEKKVKFEICLPFGGFYNMHAEDFGEIDRLADDWTDRHEGDIPESLMALARDGADYEAARLAYSKEYCASLLEYAGLDGEFSAMTSPRWYNFETDRIFATVDRAAIARLWRGVDKADLQAMMKRLFTSRDGFISGYSNCLADWGRLSDWDHNQLGTLLLVWLETEKGGDWDFNDELSLVEDLQGNGGTDAELYDTDDCKRFWKIWDYLEERSNRPVKNMDQWRVAFAKPADTLPLWQASL